MTERLALFFGLQVAFGIDPLGLLRRERSSLEAGPVKLTNGVEASQMPPSHRQLCMLT